MLKENIMRDIRYKNFKKSIRTRLLSLGIGVIFGTGLSSCTVGPNYVRPKVEVPAKYKEAPKGWKIAQPCDDIDRGPWWVVFNNNELNALERRLNISNQNIAAAEAQYQQSQALVAEARAGLFPLVTASAFAERQKPAASTFNANSGTGTSGQTTGNPTSLPPFNTFIASYTASWELDIWGSVRRMIEAAANTSQATAAQLAAVRLSSQSLLAQDYFQLRTLDATQKLLDDTAKADQKILNMTQAGYHSGTNSLADVSQAISVLKAAQASAINNGIARAQFEHAIATLIGLPPAEFSLPPRIIAMHPPKTPAQIPSTLLERRPDIAEAERQVAAANAQVGVAVAAFFPVVTLSSNGGYQSNLLQHLFTTATSFWAIAANASETVFAGGLQLAQLSAARSAYDQTVANYREVVLSAFQNVEDNLAAQRILQEQAGVQREAVKAAVLSLKLQLADYGAGTSNYIAVLTTQTNTFSIQLTNAQLIGQQMNAAVGLITALGGGWSTSDLPPGY